MTDFNVNYGGAINGADTTLAEQRALYLKLFGAEVIDQFPKHTVMDGKYWERPIRGGKSISFPVIGNLPDAHYHVPGTALTGQGTYQNEVIINVDELLVNDLFFADIDEALMPYDVRSRYAAKMAAAMAQVQDRFVMLETIRAAQSGATVTGGSPGLVITDSELASATDATRYASWLKQIFAVAENFQNKFVPGPYYMVMQPADYNFLTRSMTANGISVIHKDIGGVGSIAQASIGPVAEVNLIKTPMLPTANYSAEKYHNIDARNTKAIAFTNEAVGVVKLMGIEVQTEPSVKYQGTLVVCRMALGMGVLRPECAVHLRTAAP